MTQSASGTPEEAAAGTDGRSASESADSRPPILERWKNVITLISSVATLVVAGFALSATLRNGDIADKSRVDSRNGLAIAQLGSLSGAVGSAEIAIRDVKKQINFDYNTPVANGGKGLGRDDASPALESVLTDARDVTVVDFGIAVEAGRVYQFPTEVDFCLTRTRNVTDALINAKNNTYNKLNGVAPHVDDQLTNLNSSLHALQNALQGAESNNGSWTNAKAVDLRGLEAGCKLLEVRD
jgi:hypothetical protein